MTLLDVLVPEEMDAAAGIPRDDISIAKFDDPIDERVQSTDDIVFGLLFDQKRRPAYWARQASLPIGSDQELAGRQLPDASSQNSHAIALPEMTLPGPMMLYSSSRDGFRHSGFLAGEPPWRSCRCRSPRW